MNITKGLVGLLIFLCLFVGAWFLDQNMKRDHKTIIHIDQMTDDSEIRLFKAEAQHEPFMPREYIRIRKQIDH